MFEPQMQLEALERLSLESDLRRAVREHELRLVYQPIVDLYSGQMTGVEALVRWHDEQRGEVSPAQFIPIAEDTGLILGLGEWVLREAAAQLARWRLQFIDAPLCVSVNVSTRQLERPGLLDVLDQLLRGGLVASEMVLEITETALSVDDSMCAETLQGIRDRGFDLAVDDFGTGYSSLSRLRSAPVSRLKIDRSFISEILHGGSQVPIVDATAAMAQGLGLQVVAEGIETLAQLNYLRRLGCAQAQGYILARPLHPAQIETILAGSLPWDGLLAQLTDATAWLEQEFTHWFDAAAATDSAAERLLNPLLNRLQQMTGLTSTYVMRLSEDQTLLDVAYATNGVAPILAVGDVVDWDVSLCKRALETGVRRSNAAAATFPELAIVAKLGIASFVVEPIYDQEGRLYGTLSGAGRRSVAVTQAHSDAFAQCAQLIGSQLHILGLTAPPSTAPLRLVTQAPTPDPLGWMDPDGLRRSLQQRRDSAQLD